MSKLLELLGKHAKLVETTKIDPNESPATTRPGVAAMVNKAKTDLAEITSAISQEIRVSCSGILLYGSEDKQLEFVTLAKNLDKCVVLDSNELYAKAASEVLPMLGPNKSWFPEMTHRAMRSINEITALAMAPEIMWPPLPPYFIENDKKLVEFVRDNSRKVNGDSVNLHYLNWKLTQLIIQEKTLDKKPIVIFINSLPQQTAIPFLSNKVIVKISDDDILTEETVLEQILNVKGA